MIKTYCDKCGKEIENYSTFRIMIYTPEIRFWSDDYIPEREGHHICRNCIKLVADFITSKEEEKPIDHICNLCRHKDANNDKCKQCKVAYTDNFEPCVEE